MKQGSIGHDIHAVNFMVDEQNYTVVFSSLSPMEIALVQVHLENEGYLTSVRGEHRVGLAGELPADDARIELMVRSFEAREALALIRSVLSSKQPAWNCQDCQTKNPGSFELCWHCRGLRF